MSRIRVKASFEELIGIGIGWDAAERMARGDTFEVLNYRILMGRRLLFLRHYDERSQWGLWIYEDMTEDVCQNSMGE